MHVLTYILVSIYLSDVFTLCRNVYMYANMLLRLLLYNLYSIYIYVCDQ